MPSTNDMNRAPYLVRFRWLLILTVPVCSLFLFLSVHAAGVLDSSFGIGGKISFGFTATSEDRVADAALQADGKIIIVGSFSPLGQSGGISDFLVCRVKEDGTRDTSFGNNGFVTFGFWDPEGASAVAIQPDSKILVGGNYNGGYALVRLNADGTFDSSFGNEGKTTDSGFALYRIEVLPNGKIMVFGGNYNTIDIVRYNSNGRIDLEFATQGKFRTSVPFGVHGVSMTTDTDGGILTATNTQIFEPGYGWGFISKLYRLKPDLTPDRKFGRRRGVESYAKDSNFGSLLRLRDGRLLINDVELFGRGNRRTMEFSSNGRPGGVFAIPSFSGSNRTPTSMTELPNGQLVGCSAPFGDAFLSKFSSSGVLLGTGTLDFFSLENNCARLISQPDNKILVVGVAHVDPRDSYATDIAIARYLDLTP